jgi:hypothetical protein
VVITMRDYCWRYGMKCCAHCNETVIAPTWSRYESRHRVRHSWSCESCGHEFETSVDLGTDAGAGVRKGAAPRPVPLVA